MIESNYLKDNVVNIQRLMIIPPLRKFETKSLKQLLRLSKVREYEHGECIIKEGDMDPWIYFLLEGKVRVEKGGVNIGIIDRTGELFGEMRILDGLTRSASVYSEGRTVCLGVDTAAGVTRLTSDERTDILLKLYRMFTEFIAIRLRTVSDELVKTRKLIEFEKQRKVQAQA